MLLSLIATLQQVTAVMYVDHRGLSGATGWIQTLPQLEGSLVRQCCQQQSGGLGFTGRHAPQRSSRAQFGHVKSDLEMRHGTINYKMASKRVEQRREKKEGRKEGKLGDTCHSAFVLQMSVGSWFAGFLLGFFSTPPSFPSLVGVWQTQQNRSNASGTDLQGRKREVGPDRGVRERQKGRDAIGSCKEMLYTNARARATEVQQQIM